MTSDVGPVVSRAAMRGSSGAEVKFMEDGSVYKFSNDEKIAERILRQGRYLAINTVCDALPKVLHLKDRGYEMERLAPYILNSVTRNAILIQVINTMNDHFWHSNAYTKMNAQIDRDMHLSKVFNLCMDYALISYKQFEKIFNAINWSEFEFVFTHGDPTADNAMLRPSTSETVLIDPLPWSYEIPSFKCVDVGKIIQSAYNYEFIRYPHLGKSPDVFPLDDVFKYAKVESTNEKLACIYFGAVHFLRALPYVPTEMVSKLRTFGMRQLLNIALEMTDNDEADSSL